MPVRSPDDEPSEKEQHARNGTNFSKAQEAPSSTSDLVAKKPTTARRGRAYEARLLVHNPIWRG
ncbi:hypothetical protein PDE_06543 [Penicillium oxalicum 114-2]|uniref:Uncharacterized protein n=1 Tax=Penicillium oxalicum (strain 114-2 / CGMCC 5302) TaxID=933388 RepID=S8AYU3_PENO1|nr:hypothetical protein PDE_06543 [Penicillium oxalicum 114-2]